MAVGLEPILGTVGYEVDADPLKGLETLLLDAAAAADLFVERMARIDQAGDAAAASVSGSSEAYRDLAAGVSAAESGLSEIASSTAAARAGLEGVERSARESSEGLERVDAAADAARAGLDGIEDEARAAARALDDVDAGSRRASDGVGDVGTRGASAGVGLRALVAGGLAVGGAAAGLNALSEGVQAVTAAIGEATSASAEYSQSIAFIGTLGGEAAARTEEYRGSILAVAQTLGQDVLSASRAVYDSISSGIAPENAIAFLEASSKAATAGLSSVDTAGKALTVTLNSYNLDAKETTNVSDALFAAANVGVTTFDELASSFGGVASVSAASNASYQETLASLAQITTKGASTSEAVTQLRSIFTSLSKPTAEVSAALQEQGFASASAAIEAKGLQYVLELVRQTADETGKPLISLVGTSEAVNGILATTGKNAEGAREKIAALAGAAGQTQAAFDRISEEPAQRMAVFRSSVEAAKISLGDVFMPVLTALLDAVTPLIQGFTTFAQETLVPLAQGFGDLPEPIRLILGLLTGLLGGLATVAGGALALGAVFAPLVGLFTGGGVAAGAASTAVTGLTGAAATAAGILGTVALPLTIIVGAAAALAVASNQADEALQAQFDTLDKSVATMDDYAAASQRARDEAGIFTSIGFGLNDMLSETGDELLILKDQAASAFASATSAVGGFFSSIADGISSGLGLDKVAESTEPTKAAIIDAAEAFLQFGTNVAPAVLESDEFRLAQAKLSEQLRSGALDQDEYEQALLATANAYSQAQGGAAVLTRAQEGIAGSVGAMLGQLGQADPAMAAVAATSEELAAKQGELAVAVAQGAISTEEARTQYTAYLGELAAQDEATQSAIAANAALASGYADLIGGVESGSVSFAEAQGRLGMLAEQAGATKTQVEEMAAGIQSAASNSGLEEFGLGLDLSTIADPDKLQKALDDARNTVNDSIAGIFSEQLSAREKFASDELSLQSEHAEALAAAEGEAAAAIAEARAAGDEGKVASIQEGLAKELAAINDGNAEKLKSLNESFEQERQARLTALAQAALDQVNSLLQLGQISEEQAQIIFGSLKSAAPDSTLFDPAAQAALSFSALLGQATSGNVEAAVGLGDALRGVDDALDVSAAKAEEYSGRSVVAYENAKLAVEGHTTTSTEALAGYGSAEDAAAAMTETASGRIVVAHGARSAQIDITTQSAVTHGSAVTESEGAAAAATETASGQIQTALTSTAGAYDATGQKATEMASTVGVESARASDATNAGVAGIKTGLAGAAGEFQTLGSRAAASASTVHSSFGSVGDKIASSARVGVSALGELDTKQQAVAQTSRDLGDASEGGFQTGADAAESAARNVGRATSDIKEGAGEASEGVVKLGRDLQGLPENVRIPIVLTGIDEAIRDVERLRRAIESLPDAGQDGGNRLPPGPIIPPLIPDDPEDSIEPPDWFGGLAEGAGRLAETFSSSAPLILVVGIEDQSDGLLSETNGGELLYQTYLRQLASADYPVVVTTDFDETQLLAGIDAAKDHARDLLDTLQQQYAVFYNGNEGAEGSLAWLLTHWKDSGFTVENFAEIARQLNVPVATIEQFRTYVSALDPDTQATLWKRLYDDLRAMEKDRHDQRVDALKIEGKQHDEALAAAKEAAKAFKSGDESEEAVAARGRVAALEAMRETARSESEAAISRENARHENVMAHLEEQDKLLKRQHEDQKAAQKELADLEKQRLDAQKQFVKELREEQKAVEEVEKDAHSIALSRLADLKDLEEQRHDARMAALETEKDREDARHDEAIAFLEGELDAARRPLTDLEKQAARMKLDLATLKVNTSSLAVARDLAADLKAALSDLPKDTDEIRRKNPTGQVNLDERARGALQAALDAGKLDEDQARRASRVLAGGRLGLEQMRALLAAAASVTDEQVKKEEAAIKAKERELELLNLQIDTEKLRFEADREAIQARINQEKSRHDLAMSQIADRTKIEKQAWDEFARRIDAAKKAEDERHKAKMKQIEIEFRAKLIAEGLFEEAGRDPEEAARKAAEIADKIFAQLAALVGTSEPGGPPPGVDPGGTGIGGARQTKGQGGKPPSPAPPSPPGLPFGGPAVDPALGGAVAGLAGLFDTTYSSAGALDVAAASISAAADRLAVDRAAERVVSLQNWGPIFNGAGVNDEFTDALKSFLGVR